MRKKAVTDMALLCKTLSNVLELNYDYVYKRLTETVSGEVTVKKQVEKDKISELLQYGFSGV